METALVMLVCFIISPTSAALAGGCLASTTVYANTNLKKPGDITNVQTGTTAPLLAARHANAPVGAVHGH